MSPEEKAIELIDKYCGLLKLDYPISRSMKLCATRCAIICVEQTIKAVRDFDDELYGHEGVRMTSHREYYEQVLEVIKNK